MTKKITCIVNLHQVDVALKYSKRIVGVESGRIVYDGPPEGVTQDVIRRIYKSDGQDLIIGV